MLLTEAVNNPNEAGIQNIFDIFTGWIKNRFKIEPLAETMTFFISPRGTTVKSIPMQNKLPDWNRNNSVHLWHEWTESIYYSVSLIKKNEIDST